MSVDFPFTKTNLDGYLKALAKEYRKRSGGVRAEIILIGGASVLINYGFRELTYDVDAYYSAPGVMKDAINAVRDTLGLPNGWLNSDFKNTNSFTPRLAQYSEYYRTYSNVLEIRTIRAEYLIAMKLVSGRKYKKDLSDIVGILYEQSRAGKPITYEAVDKAVINLYGSWDKINEFSRSLLMAALETDDLERMFVEQIQSEAEAREAVLEIDKKYPNYIREDNINDVIEKALAKKKKDRDSEAR